MAWIAASVSAKENQFLLADSSNGNNFVHSSEVTTYVFRHVSFLLPMSLSSTSLTHYVSVQQRINNDFVAGLLNSGLSVRTPSHQPNVKTYSNQVVFCVNLWRGTGDSTLVICRIPVFGVQTHFQTGPLWRHSSLQTEQRFVCSDCAVQPETNRIVKLPSIG